MAEKEATVYVVDVGKSMGKKHHGRDETDLDWSMNYVWDRIATTISTGRKTANAAVVAFRTDGSSNELDADESYRHISVLQQLGQVLMPDLRRLYDEIKPSGTNNGDAISALVVAIQLITSFCKKLKYLRKIVLVTNGTGYMDTDSIDQIIKKVKEDNIELVVLGVDFDNLEYGIKEENKELLKETNESLLKGLAEDCNGVYGTVKEAIDEMGIPRVKSVRPVPSYRGQLTLGNPEQYDTALSIDVERFPKTSIMRAPAASNFVVRPDMAPSASLPEKTNGDADHADNGDGLSVVRQARTYQVKDDNAPGGKRDVERDDLAKGYEYGRTAVHISESDETITKLESKAGFEIVGFVPQESYEHYMNMSKSNVVIAQRTNDKAAMALSSLIRALYELDSYAIARLVTKDGKSPELVLLAPLIEPDYECLIDVEVPFAEDVRAYKFPPLDRIVTVSGKVLTEHRNIPTKGLRVAMDNFVDEMDLSVFDKDEDGAPVEYMPMQDTFSPIFHRLTQAIRYRAIHPTDPVPPPHDAILKYMNPPEKLVQKVAPQLKALKEAADVKKVPPKALSKKHYRGTRQEEQPRSGLDVTALLAKRSSSNQNRIDPENAIPEFKQILVNADDIDVIKTAVKQFGKIIEEWIRNSMGDSGYERAIEGIAVMRQECIETEEPGEFNSFAKGLKSKLLQEELGGDRREMWWNMRKSKLGLIDNKTSSVSDVDEEEAKSFLSAGYS